MSISKLFDEEVLIILHEKLSKYLFSFNKSQFKPLRSLALDINNNGFKYISNTMFKRSCLDVYSYLANTIKNMLEYKFQ